MKALLVSLMAMGMLLLSSQSLATTSAYCPALAPTETDEMLVIGTKFSPPFVMGGQGNLTGLSIDLFTLVASCMGLEENTDYRFQEYGTADELIDAVQTGELDLAIAALSISPEREAKIDFSHRYFEASLGAIVASRDSSANFGLVVARILQSNLLNIIFGLLGFMFIVAVYYWWTERKKGNDFFAQGPLKGFYQALIWATLLVFQGRGDPFSLNTRFGQLFVLFLMFFGVTIISSFTAVITSSLTLQALEPDVKTVADLPAKKLAVKNLSFAASWVQEADLLAQPLQTFQQVQQKFDEAAIDVFIHDREILQYLVADNALENVKLAPLSIEPQDYAIAMPENSPLRESINQSILTILADPYWASVQRQYLGE